MSFHSLQMGCSVNKNLKKSWTCSYFFEEADSFMLDFHFWRALPSHRNLYDFIAIAPAIKLEGLFCSFCYCCSLSSVCVFLYFVLLSLGFCFPLLPLHSSEIIWTIHSIQTHGTLKSASNPATELPSNRKTGLDNQGTQNYLTGYRTTKLTSNVIFC